MSNGEVGTTPARRPGLMARRELGPELAGGEGGRVKEGAGSVVEPEVEESCTYRKIFKQLISGRFPECQALLQPHIDPTTARSSRLNSAATPESGQQLLCASCCC
jgi:hypothetical protein